MRARWIGLAMLLVLGAGALLRPWSDEVARLTAADRAPRLPPSAEIRKPAMIAVCRPFSGVVPEAIASAIASGNATMATVRPAMASRRRSPRP